MSNYRDINCCESTRNVDDMFYHYHQNRKRVMDALLSNPHNFSQTLWTDKSLIPIDRKCLSLMDIDDELNVEDRTMVENPIIDSYYQCAQCRTLSRLVTLPNFEPFKIETGIHSDKELIINRYPISVPFLQVRDEQNLILKTLVNKNSLIYLGSDDYTNHILITWLLDDIFYNIGVPHVLYVPLAFICGNNGYTLSENPNVLDLDVDTKTIKELIKQLIIIFYILEANDFSYGIPDETSLVFTKDKCQYEYDGIEVDSPITLKLNNFKGSGITVSNKRFYNHSSLSELHTNTLPYEPLMDVIKINNIYHYKLRDINPRSNMIHLYMKCMGAPLYLSSFNVYSFMILMMSNQNVYTKVMGDEELRDIWQGLWLDNERETINGRIQDGKYDLFNIIKGLHLKCDAIEVLLKKI